MNELDSGQIEPYLRLGMFLGVLLIMMLSEALFPRRPEQFRRRRWPANIGLVVLNTVVLRLILPGATVALAIWTEHNHVGLLNLISLPDGLSLLLAVVTLDMLIYWQHRFSHSIPMLWRFHRLHHADTMIDVTTGARFHPVEILFSLALKLLAIFLLGPSAWAVIIFEVLLNATAMFNHSNINLPLKLDSLIRKLFVTPDMHRVHHSVFAREYNQNFGFNLAVWDYLFNSYTAQPQGGHLQMQIGLPYFRADTEAGLIAMLRQPFRQPDPE